MLTHKDIAVELENVSKVYCIHHEKPTLSEQMFRRNRVEKYQALHSINLKLYQGEKIGIVGANGAGKTTLLKIIAGITAPTTGKVKTFGKIVSLIDLEAGFHPDLTGEENIFLNGLIIGMSKSEIKQNFESIVKFADIGDFIDAPLYTYSAGMKLRIGFSVAVHADPDILILDEGIAVGDQNFQEKSSAKIEEFFKAKKTILMVTHQLDYIKKHCDKIIWIDKHKMYKTGGRKVIEEYKQFYT